MANKKISQLTEVTTLPDAALITSVDLTRISGDQNVKIKKSNLITNVLGKTITDTGTTIILDTIAGTNCNFADADINTNTTFALQSTDIINAWSQVRITTTTEPVLTHATKTITQSGGINWTAATDLYLYVRDLGSSGFLYSYLPFNFQQSGEFMGLWYVDSLNGLDTNDGMSELNAVKTLTKLKTLLSDGDVVNIAKGSYWREDLDVVMLDNLIVQSYGVGNIPVIDGSDIVDTFTLVSGQTNTWEYTITYVATTPVYPYIVEDGIMLRPAVDLSAVESTPGTFVDYGSQSDIQTTYTIQFHPSDGGNPNTNGKIYEVPTRNTVRVGANGFISDVLSRNCAGKDNIKVNAVESHQSNIIVENGSVHSNFSSLGTSGQVDKTDGGSVSNIVALDLTGFIGLGASTTFVSYQDDATGLEDYYYNNSSYLRHYTYGNTAFYSHASTSAQGPKKMVYVGNNAYNSGTMFGMLSDGEIFIDKCSGQKIGAVISNLMAKQTILNSQFLISSTVDHFNSRPSTNTTWRNNGFFVGHDATVNTEFIRKSVTSDFIYENNVFVTFNRRDFMLDQTSSGATTFNRNVFFGRSSFRQLDIGTGVTYTGDYNIFMCRDLNGTHGGLDFQSRYQGTNHTSLLSWQTATGQDTNSVYVAQSQVEGFWLGDPRTGDFRINPYAQVTGGDGTVYTGTFPNGTPLVGFNLDSPNVGVDHSHFNNTWVNIPKTVADAQAILKQ